MKLENKIDLKHRKRIYSLDGEVDVHQVKEIKNQLIEDLNENPDWTYILDFTRVTYLDSSGLGLLIYLKKETKRRGGNLILANLSEQVANVFKMTKLEDFFGLSG